MSVAVNALKRLKSQSTVAAKGEHFMEKAVGNYLFVKYLQNLCRCWAYNSFTVQLLYFLFTELHKIVKMFNSLIIHSVLQTFWDNLFKFLSRALNKEIPCCFLTVLV